MNETRLKTIDELAGEVGFEPTLRDPESRVLPLDYSPVLAIASATDVRWNVHSTQSKIRRFFRGVKGILPLILPKKAARIGLQIQSQLSNPLRPIISPPPIDINIHRHRRRQRQRHRQYSSVSTMGGCVFLSISTEYTPVGPALLQLKGGDGHAN